jgi:predicted nucleic acid-binding protein
MAAKTRVFLDASALFAGIWSDQGGARMVLRLGEAGAIQLLVSAQVLDEAEAALRRKAPQTLGVLALLLERSGVRVVPSPQSDVVQRSRTLTGHAGDAQVLAAAWFSQVDYFVTLDRKHFLDNAALRETAPFPIGTPGDFLAWHRGQLATGVQ